MTTPTRAEMSPEALLLLDFGREVYKFYFNHLNQLRTTRFKIQTWDAGWWQIRNVLDDDNLGLDLLAQLKSAHLALKEKLLPQVYEYGFLG